MSDPWAIPKGVTVEDWLDFLVGAKSLEGRKAPPLPDPALQSSFVGSAGREAFSEGSAFCLRMAAEMERLGTQINSDTRILDFGCGWGRLYRIMLRLCSPANLIGSDLQDECISICSSAMPYGTFIKTEVTPPFPFADHSFHCIYAYSVFSHLSESMFRRYFREFSRILKPGGVVAFTTLKPLHLEVWKRQAAGTDPYYTGYLRQAAFNYDQWKVGIDNGQFLFVPTGGGNHLDGSFYGEAVIPESFLQSVSGSMGFELRAFDTRDVMPQTFAMLQKAN